MSTPPPGGPAASSAAASGTAAGRLDLRWRPFSFPLPAMLHTASGGITHRRGWLLRLETNLGFCGWGEAAPLAFGRAAEREVLAACALAIQQLGASVKRGELERQLAALPPSVAFAIGAALAEADGWLGPAGGGSLPVPPSAWLLPAGEGAIDAAQALLQSAADIAEPAATPPLRRWPPTFKWKVGVHPVRQEQSWYGELVALLPQEARLRLDANGGLDRATARRWAAILQGERRLEWFEQPLPPVDHEGLVALARQLPVALDESLRHDPALRRRWPGWQVRRPSQEGDPRPLLRELKAGRPWWMVSTSFETGIGRRWLAHLAGLQAAGPTPTAPGLAPGWQAPGELAAPAPETVWQAAQGG